MGLFPGKTSYWRYGKGRFGGLLGTGAYGADMKERWAILQF